MHYVVKDPIQGVKQFEQFYYTNPNARTEKIYQLTYGDDKQELD